MALVRALYGRIEHLVREVAKFGIVGGLSYIVTIVFNYAYLLFQHNNQITAYIVANVVATAAAYLGNRYWTYKDRDAAGDAREMALFVAINAIAIAIQVGVEALTFYVLHMTSHVENFFSKFVLAIGIGMAFRFWSYRTFIFPQAEPALASDEFQYSEPLPAAQPAPQAARAETVAVLSVSGR